jgi:hypothetical protein
MSKVFDIESLLLKAPVKKRILTAINYIASVSLGKEPPFTQADYIRILDSLNTAKEVDLYNKYSEYDVAFKELLHYLNQLRIATKTHLTRLLGNFRLINTYNNFIASIKLALPEIKDKGEQLKVLKSLEENIRFYRSTFYINPKIDKEIHYNDILLLPDVSNSKEPSLKQTCLNDKTEIEGYYAKAKAVIDVLNETIKANRYDIKAYKEFIKEVEGEFKTPVESYISNAKYSKKKNNLFFELFPVYSTIERDEATYQYLYDKMFKSWYSKL